MAGYKKLNSLKPITEADIQKEKEQHPSNDKEFTDNTNLDAYIDMVEQTGTKEIMEKDVEIESLKNKLMMSENKVRELESEIEKLKLKLNSNDITTLNNKIKEMDKENDNILLRNSELEFEVTKLSEINKTLTKEIDTFKKTRTIPKYNPTPNERHTDNIMKKYPKQNGYESWN